MGGGVLAGTATKSRIGGWVIRPPEPTTSLVAAVACSLSVSVAVLASAGADQSQLGAPTSWPWILTALQVVALGAAGQSFWWGWLLGASVQMPWIAYAIVTGQIGFIPGCVVSAMVQTHSFIQSSREPHSGRGGVVRGRSMAVRRAGQAI
ncbi:hypothetical protein BH23ACT4_BH23ACT4_09940 [soil metagenome]